jgi:GNAT superfamily N-acetyltransferase
LWYDSHRKSPFFGVCFAKNIIPKSKGIFYCFLQIFIEISVVLSRLAFPGANLRTYVFLTPQTAVFRRNPGEKSFLSAPDPLRLGLRRTAQLALKNCWCMAWRMTKDEQKTNTPACRKGYIKKRIENGVPIGLLAYADERAVAWCSVGPKSSFNNNLGGDAVLENIWSLTCFFVLPAYRKKGVTHLLVESAKEYALNNGGHYLEAYPVDRNSPSCRHMGFVETFMKEGFSFTAMAGSRRHVMIYRLLSDNSRNQ